MNYSKKGENFHRMGIGLYSKRERLMEDPNDFKERPSTGSQLMNINITGVFTTLYCQLARENIRSKKSRGVELMTYVDIGLKLFLGLIALLIVTRLLGKKEMSQLTPFDFIYSLVLGGILEESIYDDKVSALQVWFAVAVWGVLLFIIEKLSKRFDKIRVLLKGETSILIRNGEFNVKELEANHLEMEQLRIMLRQQGVFSLREVCDLYLEPGGTVSLKKFAKFDMVTPTMLNLKPEEESLNFLFIDEGEINEEILRYTGKSKEWLYEELHQEGYTSIHDILYAEWSETEGFFVKVYRDNNDDIRKGN